MKPGLKRVLRLAALALAGLLVAVLILLFGLAAAMQHEFGRTPPPPHYPRPRDLAEANQQDLDYLRQLPNYDRSFSPAAKAAFSRYLDSLMAEAGTLDRPGLEMAVARAVALADNGHTNEQGVGEGRDLNALPIRMAPFADGYYVVMTTPVNADLLGTRVVSENGRSIDDLRRALRPYEGGADTRMRQKLPNFLQSPQALHAAGLDPSATEATLVFAMPDGRQVTRTFTADSEPTPGYGWAERALSPVRPRLLAAGQPWAHVLDGQARLPLYLQHVDAAYWDARLDDAPAIYVQLNAMQDVGDRPIKTYLDGLLTQVADSHPRYAIVDLRFDGGGDYTLFANFSKRLPQLLPPDGKLFIITSGNTFSAAISTAARLKHFAGDRGVIVGEPVGDRDRFWGEVHQFRLPNSKISVQYATGMHDWVHGCTDWKRCYWINFNFMMGVAAGPLTPTLPAPLSFSDYKAGIDPAFEAIARQVDAR